MSENQKGRKGASDQKNPTNLRVGKRWETAAKKGRYLLVGEGSVDSAPKLVALSNAGKLWETNPSILYDPVHHLAGTESNLRRALSTALTSSGEQLSQSDIDKAIKGAFSKKMLGTPELNKKVQADLEKAKKLRMANRPIDMLTLLSISSAIKNAKVTSSVPKKQKKPSVSEILREKYEQVLKHNRETSGTKMVLNVSNPKIRKQMLSDNMSKLMLYPIKSIPIVSSDPARYRKAMIDILGKDEYSKYEAKVKEAIMERRKLLLTGKKRSAKKPSAMKNSPASKKVKEAKEKKAPAKKAAAKKTAGKKDASPAGKKKAAPPASGKSKSSPAAKKTSSPAGKKTSSPAGKKTSSPAGKKTQAKKTSSAKKSGPKVGDILTKKVSPQPTTPPPKVVTPTKLRGANPSGARVPGASK